MKLTRIIAVAFCCCLGLSFFTGCVTGYKALYNEGKSTVVVNGDVPTDLKVFENGEEISINQRVATRTPSLTEPGMDNVTYQNYLLLDYGEDHILTLQSGGKSAEVKMPKHSEWMWFWLSGGWILIDYYVGAINEFPDFTVPANL